MVPDLARMSVIIKSQHEASVMTGNYEMGYACSIATVLFLMMLLVNAAVRKLLNRYLD